MLGTTIASPKFRELAYEASKRFMKYTGLSCLTITTPSELCYSEKLTLPDRLPRETVVWFDADLWFLNYADLSQFDGRSQFFAVPDPCRFDENHFPAHDSKYVFNIDVCKYFNTGFFIWNNAIPSHRRIFSRALNMMTARSHEVGDFGEQSFINEAVQTMEVPLEILPQEYNYSPFAASQNHSTQYPMDNPLTVHASGYGPNDKLPFLRDFSAPVVQSNRIGDITLVRQGNQVLAVGGEVIGDPIRVWTSFGGRHYSGLPSIYQVPRKTGTHALTVHADFRDGTEQKIATIAI